MKDKSIIWLAAFGIAIWIFVAYPPARIATVRTVQNIVNTFLAFFR
jgi:hypothetical protein